MEMQVSQVQQPTFQARSLEKITTIKTNLEIPHAALIPKKNIFPKIPNKKIKN